MISNIEFNISTLTEKLLNTRDWKAPNSYLLSRMENVLDRCLSGYMRLENLAEMNNILIWNRWAHSTQNYYDSYSVKIFVDKSLQVTYLFFKNTCGYDVYENFIYLIDNLKANAEPNDPVWKTVILNLFINCKKDKIASFLTCLPKEYWVPLKDEKCDLQTIDRLQNLIDVDMVYKCILLGRIDVLEFLHQNGVNIDVKDEDGQSLLATMAVLFRQVDILKFLVEEGFTINQSWSTPPGTPLVPILWQKDLVESLLKLLPNINLLYLDTFCNSYTEMSEALIKYFIEKKCINDKHLGLMISIGYSITIKEDLLTKGELILNYILKENLAVDLNEIFISCLFHSYNHKRESLLHTVKLIMASCKKSDINIMFSALCILLHCETYLNLGLTKHYKQSIVECLHFILNHEEMIDRVPLYKSLILSAILKPKVYPFIQHFFDPKDPQCIMTLFSARVQYSYENLGFNDDGKNISLFNKLFPVEDWKCAQISSIPNQKDHWYTSLKLLFSERKVSWEKPLCNKIDKEIGKTLFNRKVIAHISDQKGEHGEEEYEGFRRGSSYFFKVLKKGYISACASLNQKANEETISFFDHSMKFNPDELFELISKGQGVSYNSGSKNHNIQILFYHPFFVIVDTGIFVKKHSFEIYFMNQEKFTKEWLEKLNKQNIRGSNKQLIQLMDELVEDLECRKMYDSFFSSGLLFPVNQLIGNCSWTSKSSVLHVYEFLKGIRKMIENELLSPSFSVSRMIEWLQSEMLKPTQLVYASIFQSLKRFLVKEIQRINEKTSKLAPDWKFLLNVMMGVQQEVYKVDEEFFMKYFADIFELCPLDQLELEQVKSKCVDNEVAFDRLYGGLSWYLRRKLGDQEMTRQNILKVVIENKRLVKAVLECCPSGSVKSSFEGLPAPLELAVFIDDHELIHSLSERILSSCSIIKGSAWKNEEN